MEINLNLKGEFYSGCMLGAAGFWDLLEKYMHFYFK